MTFWGEEDPFLSTVMIEIYITFVQQLLHPNILKKLGEAGLESLREKAKEVFRTVTYNTIILTSSGGFSSNSLASILKGYSGFSFKDPQEFILQNDISDTPDAIIMLTENRFLAALSVPEKEIPNRMRSSPFNWLIWGILTGEVSSTLVQTQHKYQSLYTFSMKRKRRQRIIVSSLAEIIRLSSSLSDPNFTQTPLLRNIVNKSREILRFDETLAIMKDNFDVLNGVMEQAVNRRISLMLLIATVSLLVFPLVSGTFKFVYLILDLTILFLVYLLLRTDL